MPLSRAAPLGNGPDHLHAEGGDFEMPRDADSPDQLASRKPLAERRAQSITRVRHDTAEVHTGRDHAIDLGERDLGLSTCRSIFDRNACTLQPRRIARANLQKKKT